MMASPLFLVSVVGIPIALVAAAMLWRRSRAISADPWYGAPVVPRIHAGGIGGDVSAPNTIETSDPECESVDPLILCEKVLFCWDYWARGKSGLHLEDVFEARDLPSELRTVVVRSREEANAQL